MTYVIAQPCVDLIDKACIEECPVDCIYEGKRMLYIHPDECVDCGACEPVCPVEAIFYEDDTPEQWKDYYKANVEFFDDLGSPGGAAKIGKIDKDHPLIAALPPQDQRGTEPRDRGAAVRGRLPRLSLGPARPVRRDRPRAPGRHRRPLGRHAGRPHARRSSAGRSRPPSDAPGYPLTHGTPALREAVVRWFARRRGVHRASTRPAVLPTIGSKELVAWLPTLLGLGPGDVVVHPEVAYPTYDVGARLAGATPVAADGLTAARPAAGPPGLAELPGQPDRPGAAGRAPAQGRRLGPRARRGGGLRRVLRRAGLGRAATGRRVLHPRRLRRRRTTGLLAVYSLSKQSNLAGYRAGVRRRRPGAGPRAARGAQARRDDRAGAGAGRDGRGARRRRARRTSSARATGARRDVLRAALERAGLRVDDSEAGLYLWATRDEDCWASVRSLAAARDPGRAGGVLRPGRRTARAGGADRHRRAGRGGGVAAADPRSRHSGSALHRQPSAGATCRRTLSRTCRL